MNDDSSGIQDHPTQNILKLATKSMLPNPSQDKSSHWKTH